VKDLPTRFVILAKAGIQNILTLITFADEK